MSRLLVTLKELDERLLTIFGHDEPDISEIPLLVEEREQILQRIISEFGTVPGFKDSPEWQEAVSRTKQVVQLMQLKTGQAGEQLKKYRYGNKSVKRYQQFL